MTIDELVREAESLGKEKGYFKSPPNIERSICLIHTEVSEAMNALRKGRMGHEHFRAGFVLESDDDFPPLFGRLVKDTFPDEMADIVIRVATLCAEMDIDLESQIRAKLRFNRGRNFSEKITGNRF